MGRAHINVPQAELHARGAAKGALQGTLIGPGRGEIEDQVALSGNGHPARHIPKKGTYLNLRGGLGKSNLRLRTSRIQIGLADQISPVEAPNVIGNLKQSIPRMELQLGFPEVKAGDFDGLRAESAFHREIADEPEQEQCFGIRVAFIAPRCRCRTRGRGLRSFSAGIVNSGEVLIQVDPVGVEIHSVEDRVVNGHVN